MFCSIVLIRRITITVAGRNVSPLSLEKSLPQVVSAGKQVKVCIKMATANLPSLLVLTYTYFLQCSREIAFSVLKIEYFSDSIHGRATNSPPTIRHFNGVSLAGR